MIQPRRMIFFTIPPLLLITSLTQQATPPNKPTHVKVEVSTSKKSYAVGEQVYFKATLINDGENPVYIAKTWSYAGGGVAGFYVHVTQLSGGGGQSGMGCAENGDRFRIKDSRSPEQILREDFVQLGRGEFVGMEAPYHGCEVEDAGTYEITGTYSANDFNTQVVLPLGSEGTPVLTASVDSEPYRFSVRSRRKSAK